MSPSGAISDMLVRKYYTTGRRTDIYVTPKWPPVKFKTDAKRL
jgi:hypothetical protein